MEIKPTTQGILIYSAMAAYLLAFILYAFKRAKVASALACTAFLAAAAAFTYRWFQVRHIPFQNLFEVFLSLGLLIYPISILSKKLFRINADTSDMLIGFILLFPAGFVFTAEPQQLPPALQSWLFAPHVAVYMLSYVIMAKAAIQAVHTLRNKQLPPDTTDPEKATYLLIAAGFPLLTLGLLLGSVWGQLAWGDWWGWDPKEMWSLASWLVYAIYLHYRYTFSPTHRKRNSLIAIAGFAVILITLLWVNLSKIFPSLHSYAT